MRPNDAKLISPTGCSEVSRRGKHLKRGQAPVGEARRVELLAFAERYIREHGYAPSSKIIRANLFISRTNLFYHMRALKESGQVVGPGSAAGGWTLPKFAAACKKVE